VECGGSFHSNENFEKGTDGMEIPLRKASRKYKIFEFPKGELFIRNVLEIPGRKAIGTVLPFEKFSGIFVFLARLSSISEFRTIAVPLATRVFQKLTLKIFIKWNFVPCEANHRTFLCHRRRSAIKIILNNPIWLKSGSDRVLGSPRVSTAAFLML